MTKQQFQDQFKIEIIPDPDFLEPDQVLFDTQVFRALQLLVILKDNGRYYIK